jgi:hypothetical protein
MDRGRRIALLASCMHLAKVTELTVQARAIRYHLRARYASAWMDQIRAGSTCQLRFVLAQQEPDGSEIRRQPPTAPATPEYQTWPAVNNPPQETAAE